MQVTQALLLLYYCFTTALRLLYYCFTTTLLLRFTWLAHGMIGAEGYVRFSLPHPTYAHVCSRMLTYADVCGAAGDDSSGGVGDVC